jgi:competence protein ComFC
MTFREFYYRFVAVHKCGGCGEILPWNLAHTAFCEECQQSFDADVLTGCTECFLPARECGCMPHVLKQAGALTLRKCFFYREDREYSPSMRLLYWIKHRKSRRMTSYVAEQMLGKVTEELSAFGISSPDAVCIAYVPRGKASRMAHGFDQSRLVAERLGEILGYTCVHALYTAHTVPEQKDLGRNERLKNARSAIRIRKNADVRDKYVILVDDVVTTGASMSVCVRALMGAGARGVICVALAVKPKK